MEVLVGERSILAAATALERIRQQSGQGADVPTSISWFLRHAARSNALPVVVMARDGVAPGAVLLHGRKAFGVPLGVLKGGSLCGRGSVIGSESRQPALVEAAVRRLFHTPLAHTVVVTLLRSDHAAVSHADPAEPGLWRMRTTRNSLSLVDGIDGLMSKFSAKMRRNFRYYRLRAERDLGCVFLPQLSPEQARQAVAAMHGQGAHRVSLSSALQREAALRVVPGSFTMGLTSRSGQWLSLLAGWRRPEASYIEWQINSDASGAASISTAMRNYWLHHEIDLGTSQVVFVGETTPAWSRACAPQVCGDLLATRLGLTGAAVREISRRVSPAGKVSQLREQPGTSFYAPLLDTQAEP